MLFSNWPQHSRLKWHVIGDCITDLTESSMGLWSLSLETGTVWVIIIP